MLVKRHDAAGLHTNPVMSFREKSVRQVVLKQQAGTD
jgi:hypothetical protein